MSMIFGLFRRRDRDATIAALYGAIVAQARLPAFYAGYGVPDTINGRFDLIVLHLALVLRRLRREGEAARAFGQNLFDHFCTDMDDNLREIGVGDLAVPREMRKMADAFYGRLAAYEAALAAASEQELANALTRNVFSGSRPADGAARLARYVAEAVRQLDEQDRAGLERGEIGFPDPEASGFPEARVLQ
jgi:cytochrome b pre-mRNA-processing protein 3